MGMFHDLMSKIFAHAAPAKQTTVASNAPTSVPTSAPEVGAGAPADTAPSAADPAAPSAAPATTPATSVPGSASGPVDVAAVLDGLAEKNSESLDWKKSIVDLLKLVGMDSSLSARKELARDLNYPGDESDSASMNVWLHKAVLQKLAANGGKVPAELLG